MSGRVDPITLGVVWGALQSVTVEIGTAVQHTAYSDQAREGQDFSVAVFDREGRMSAQGPYSPGHMGAMNFVVRNVLDAFPAGELRPGDVVLLNDPALGSGHLPDFFMTQPVYAGEELVGFAVNIVHHTDVGGSRPGSQAVEGIFDYHQEGLLIPPVKVVDEGRDVDAVLAIIRGNTRTPDKVMGDLRAQRHALRVGEERLAELYARYDVETVDACIEEILDQTEERMRGPIRDIPDGTYAFEDFLDDHGPGTDALRLHVAVTVDGDDVVVDFDGTSPQTESGLNAYFNYTCSYTYAALKCLTDPFGPMNAGALRPLTITAPEGTVLNPRRPAGGGPRAIMCGRIFEVIIGALAQALPEEAAAASANMANPTWGGYDPASGRRFVTYELVLGGTGARAEKDGCEGMSWPFNAANIPVEAMEASQPLVVERFELVPDTGGAGRFRGGCAIRRDIRILGENVKLSNLSERQRFAPWGLFGGHSGSPGSTVSNPGTDDEHTVPGKASVDLEYGDVISFRLAGGGGYGDPKERRVDLVARDVRLGFVSVEAAREVYGVAVDASGAVDEEATAAIRDGHAP